MAPRKKSSSSSLKKSNQNNQSQPSKFGIQHFFDRHTQNAAASTSQNPKRVPNSQESDPKNPSQSTPPANPPTIGVPTVGNAGENPLEVSPEMSKSVSFKRFKFSPGMLIKQSQDDGGDEVTWRISPVNERLHSVTKHLPEMMRALADASRQNGSNFRHCSKKHNSPGSGGKLEKWLSSPTLTAPERSLVSSKRVSLIPVDPYQVVELPGIHGSAVDMNTTGAVHQQSPFRTPPSISCCSDAHANSAVCNGAIDQLGSRQHRKALLELLDQVEDVISAEDSMPNDTDKSLSKSHARNVGEMAGESDHMVDKASSDIKFLILEVSEKHGTADSSCAQSPSKVLRLLNEHNGEECAVHLQDEWYYSVVGPGDAIHVIGDFDDQGKCKVDHDNNLIIVHPDILVSGTRVASSFSCPRRTVLDVRLKSSELSYAALLGTLLHQIFQAGLVTDFPTEDLLVEHVSLVLQKNIENLYACGVNENDTRRTLIEAIPRILNWINCFRDLKETEVPTIGLEENDGQKEVSIAEVIDIEEMAWAPRYGLKGMIDASVRAKVYSNINGASERIMPLEFKSGKGTSGQVAMEHNAQVILYTLLMSERYLRDIDSGLLYYLQTDQTQVVVAQRSDLVGLIMRRNELASDILKASTIQKLPPMLQNLNVCKSCRHLNVCTIYHKAHGGNREGSGLGDMFNSHVEHLTDAHYNFLRQWDRLIDLEAKETQAAKRGRWRSQGLGNEYSSGGLFVILDPSNDISINKPSKDGRFIYHFVRPGSSSHDVVMHHEEKQIVDSPLANDLNCALKSGDYVILSTKSSHVAVANGVITVISRHHVSVSFSRRLRLPKNYPSSGVSDLLEEVWHIDKDEVITSYAIMRFNLIQLFVQNAQSSRLRKMIVDLEVPRFDSGGIFSQDPAISYICSEKNLNNDQRRSILKILTAKDYALILGMPGTGKTSTMVHAVKALLIRGASILLTSYTNSAVDNLLIKLKSQGIDFIRIGRYEAVHEEVRAHCFSAMGVHSVEDVRRRLEQVNVVAVTCLGITHPLLANKKFDICIMDEAGQTTLPVSLGPLMFASMFVLVGDHYQLPPLVQSTEARENGLGISLFCRLSEAHPQAISALQYQYRMCAGIMELSNALIYGNKLRCGSSEIANSKLKFLSPMPITSWLKGVYKLLGEVIGVKFIGLGYRPYGAGNHHFKQHYFDHISVEVFKLLGLVLDPNKSVIFINTDMLPAFEAKDRKTANNPTEAYIVAKITEELVKQGVTGEDIGIITPYNSQANLIQRLVCSISVEIHTIDKYQGRDKDCILLSFVRSTENPRAYTSSLLGDWHRINVALTRAKKKLIMVGSCRTLSKVPLLKLLIEKVDEQSGILSVSKEDVNLLGELKRCSQVR